MGRYCIVSNLGSTLRSFKMVPADAVNKGGCLGSKTCTTHYHGQLGLPNKALTLKELIVGRRFDKKNDALGNTIVTLLLP